MALKDYPRKFGVKERPHKSNRLETRKELRKIFFKKVNVVLEEDI